MGEPLDQNLRVVSRIGGSKIERIYAAVYNKQANHQASVVEMEGMITNH
jgi:hypothetical protein